MASSTATANNNNTTTSKPARTSQTTSPPTPSSGSHHGPKLPKFLTKQSRDRSKSVNDSTSTIASTSSSTSMSPVAEGPVPAAASATGKHRSDRRGSKLKGVLKELKDDRIGQISQGERHIIIPSANGNSEREQDFADESMEDTPVIVEPVLAPARPRPRAERPLSASVSSTDSHPAVSYYPSNHSAGSTQRLSDMGTRLSGWFSHTFSTSSTDLSLPALLSNSAQMSASPKSKSPALGLLTAARHGKGYLDKGLRYVLDSDATPDKCTDPIWLLGVQHPGYEPPPPSPPPVSSPPPGNGRRSSLDIRRSSSFRASLSSSRGAASSPEPSTLSLSTSQSGKHPKDSGVHWPPVFYLDFTSRVWLTYRSHFAPIRDQSLAQLEVEASGQPQSQLVSASPRRWNWPGVGEKGWTSDSGWGCMLRTGQSLLANALIHLHLGRDWRKPPHPIHTADYATYVQILTWFFDSPDPGCPFSVHRMALAGKDLGKDVGQWFGPSTAAGAIKALTHAFPEAGLGVSVATDGVVYETDVLAASNVSPYMYRHKHSKSPSHSRAGTSSPSSRRRKSAIPQHIRNATSLDAQSVGGIWGQRPVLVLVGVRLGIQGVNPIYYDALKEIYKFPQSVGIAGGRPSSSYYFVGAQADNLFYLDPHHARPAVPFKQPPRASSTGSNGNTPDSPGSSFRDVHFQNTSGRMQQSPSDSSYASHQQAHRVSPSPSPHQHSASLSGQSLSGGSTNDTYDLDTLHDFYVSAYSPQDLSTFHCEKVRKMPLSGLDPSMLIGFLCRDERDWRDLRERMAEMGKKYKAAIFAIQDEPPSWPSDSDDMGLESVSDVDIDIEGPADAFDELPDPEERDEDVFEEPASDDQCAKRDSGGGSSAGRQSEDVMTEEDPVDPVTPGPSTASHTQAFDQVASKRDHDLNMSYRSQDEDLLGDDEEWVETSGSLGGMGTPQAHDKSHFASAVPMGAAPSNASTATTASYVSASSSYSFDDDSNDLARTVAAVNLNGGGGASSGSKSGSRNGSTGRDQERSKEREKPRESKGSKRGESSRTSKIKSSKSASSSSGRREASASASQPQQEYFPFPVVDDREPEDLMDFHELSSQSESSQASAAAQQHARQRTGTASSRTPVASVTISNSTSGGSGGGGGGGSRLRNAKARDGGRTQSGGVRGIVTSDLEDSSDF